MSARWSEQELAKYCEVHPRALRRNAFIRSLVGLGVKRGFIERSVKHDYKAEFEQQLSLVGIQVEREFYFARPRKWRSDWFVIGSTVLVEFEGGLFKKRKSGHASVAGILRDIEKYNEAAISGWIVIRVTPKHVVSGQALRWVEQAVKSSQAKTSLA